MLESRTVVRGNRGEIRQIAMEMATPVVSFYFARPCVRGTPVPRHHKRARWAGHFDFLEGVWNYLSKRWCFAWLWRCT